MISCSLAQTKWMQWPEMRFDSQFHELNHTVTQSSLNNPYISNGGFDPGFTRVNPDDYLGNIVSFVVKTTDP
jgi:hypothetical protein